ncbi:MAG: protein kinase domain-containing protein [Anaerolineae bacterium]
MLEQLIGQSLDRYQVLELLGEGGMGGVFRARDITLQRDVAIKVMHEQYARQGGFQERFLQEARTAARLDHPGIVKVFDFGQARSLLYIVMELIQGKSLRQELNDLSASARTMEIAEALQVTRQICLALAYAHEHGVLHRDIKPDNVMLKPEPSEGLPFRPVLMDLGLAKLAESGAMTVEGTAMGTPAYMAPEQALGEATDSRSDVYSVGILLYEMLAGKLPFPINTLTEAIRYHTRQVPPPLRDIRPEVPEAVERVVMTALAKDPAARYADASALAGAVTEVLDALPQPTVAPRGTQGTVVTPPLAAADADSRAKSVLAAFPPISPDPNHDRISALLPDGTVQSLLIQAAEVSIGSALGNDLVLPVPQVAAQHLRLRFDGAGYKAIDLNSQAGTYMGDRRLIPGVADDWNPDTLLRLGPCWLRLDRAARPIGQRPAGGTVLSTAQPAQRVSVFLHNTDVAAEPGASVSLSLTIVNQGPVVDHFQISAPGLPAGWLVPPPAIRLLPGAQQQVSVLIQPPRSPQSRAGVYPFALRVSSQDAPDQAGEAQARLTVLPYVEYQVSLQPQVSAAGRPIRLLVQNNGNQEQALAIACHDPAQALQFRPAQTELRVPEGQSAAATFRIRPRQRPLFGPQRSHPYSLQVTTPGAPPQTLDGEIRSAGLVPVWLPVLIAMPLIALCVAAAFLLLRPPTIRSLTIEPAIPLAGQPVTIRWDVENAQRIDLQPVVANLNPAAGEYTLPSGFPVGQALNFVASGRLGSVSQPLQIAVVTPTPGASATATPTLQPVAVVDSSPTPTVRVEQQATPTPTPTIAPPTATPTPCSVEPAAGYAAAAAGHPALGCALSPAVDTGFAVQRFEHGIMFWRQDKAVIYVLTTGAKNVWQQFADTFTEGMPEEDPALVAPSGKQQPRRGFGKVWREPLGGPSAAIGWALEREQGYSGNYQQFSAGLILRGNDGAIYVLLPGGSWVRQ